MSVHHRTKWTAGDLKTWRPRIAATLPAPCVDCRRPVYPEQRWEVGHIIPVSDPRFAGNSAETIGPSHVHCNRSAGGKLGAAKTNAAKRKGKRLPQW